ncbi:dihydroorotate oxidase B electron transfer subunit [soil metagenome]
MPLLRPVTLHGWDRVRGEVTLHLPPGARSHAWLAAMPPGAGVTFSGPLGRPLRIDARAHHLLLIADGGGIGRLRSLVDEALRSGRQVAALLGAASAAEVYPSSLLPDEVEYAVATADGSLGHHGSVLELVPRYEAWADQAFAAAAPDLLADLATLVRSRDSRLGVARLARRPSRRSSRGTSSPPRSWLQVVLEQNVGCALGVCLGCSVEGATGPVRVCREGPAFGMDELAWSEPA